MAAQSPEPRGERQSLKARPDQPQDEQSPSQVCQPEHQMKAQERDRGQPTQLLNTS